MLCVCVRACVSARVCACAQDYEKELAQSGASRADSYELPDGHQLSEYLPCMPACLLLCFLLLLVVLRCWLLIVAGAHPHPHPLIPRYPLTVISTEAFRCPEALFQPSIIGSNYTGISETMYQAIQRCDEDVRRDMFKNVVLSGGSTMFRGLTHSLSPSLRLSCLQKMHRHTPSLSFPPSLDTRYRAHARTLLVSLSISLYQRAQRSAHAHARCSFLHARATHHTTPQHAKPRLVCALLFMGFCSSRRCACADIGIRLKRELQNLAPPGTHLDVTGIPDRKYGAWIGGSILCSTTTFSRLWITKEEFKERGRGKVVHEKCF